MLLLSFHVMPCSICSSLHYLGSLAGVMLLVAMAGAPSSFLFLVLMFSKFKPFYRALWCPRVHQNSKGRKQPANTTEHHAHVHFLSNQACVQNATNKETVRTWIRAAKCICASLNPCVFSFARLRFSACALSSLQLEVCAASRREDADF